MHCQCEERSDNTTKLTCPVIASSAERQTNPTYLSCHCEFRKATNNSNLLVLSLRVPRSDKQFQLTCPVIASSAQRNEAILNSLPDTLIYPATCPTGTLPPRQSHPEMCLTRPFNLLLQQISLNLKLQSIS